jgi:flagellar protein FlaF
MAVSEIIGAAVGVLMLLITAYMLMGGVLYTADVVTSAQKDNTLLQETRLGTDFEITNAEQSSDTSININISNIGSEVIRDFSHMDIIVINNTEGYQYITLDSDIYKKIQLDPHHTIWVYATLYPPLKADNVIVVTNNGVFNSKTIS